MHSQTSVKVTLWVNRLICASVILVIFILPWMLKIYSDWRDLNENAQTAIFVAYYCCSAVVLFSQWNMERLLKNILAEQVFTQENVNRICSVRWCCLLVSLICAPASVYYLPLIFMVIIMGFLGLVVSVVANVMAAAVEIREENDMTI